MNSTILHNLTKTLILHPIGMSFISHSFTLAALIYYFNSRGPLRNCIFLRAYRCRLSSRGDRHDDAFRRPCATHHLRCVGHRHDPLRYRS